MLFLASNFINCDKLYYAVMTGIDTATALPTYTTPQVLVPAAKIQVDATNSQVAYYADGVNQEMAQVMTEGKITIQGSTIPLATLSAILGHTLDGLGGLAYGKNDIAPYVAIFYRRAKANGKYRYVKLYKCLFADPSDAAATANASVTPQDDSIAGAFYSRIYDTNWKHVTDDETAGYIDVSTTFFNQVDVANSLIAPVISSTLPLSGATSVPDTSTYQWVMSEAINPSTVTTNNFFLANDVTGVVVPGSVVYNSATFTVTFTPTASLTTATRFMAVANSYVKDMFGNALVYAERYFTSL